MRIYHHKFISLYVVIFIRNLSINCDCSINSSSPISALAATTFHILNPCKKYSAKANSTTIFRRCLSKP